MTEYQESLLLMFASLVLLVSLVTSFSYLKWLADYETTTVEEGCKGIKYKDGKFEKFLDPGSYKHHKEKERIYVVSMIEEDISYNENLYTTLDLKLVRLQVTLKVKCQDIKFLLPLNKEQLMLSKFLYTKQLLSRQVNKILAREVNKITQKIKFADLIQDYSLLNKPLFEVLQNYFPSQTGYTLLELDSILVYSIDTENYEDYDYYEDYKDEIENFS